METKLEKNIKIGLVAALVIGLLISLQVLSPILDKFYIFQDDFRQTNFWFWQFWDSELFQNDFFAENFKAGMGLAPLYNFIWKRIIPAFFTDLIYASKIYALLLALLGALAAYLAFSVISKRGDIFSALAFTTAMSVVFWCTDHVSAAHVRSSVWLVLLVYLWLKSSKRDLFAGLFCLPLQFFNPTAYILCMGVEGFSWLSKVKEKVFSQTFYLGLFNATITVLYHFVLRSGVQFAGTGKSLSLEQMKAMPEFNPGGRSAIFGSNLLDGSWWSNEHWGFGYGYLEISKVVFIALALVVVYILVCKPSKKDLISFASSTPAFLFYSSVTLYLIAQVVFPLLYFPSRYLSVTSILLATLVIVLCFEEILHKLIPSLPENQSMTRAERRHVEKKTGFAGISAISVAFVLFAFSFWFYFKKFYHPRFVDINPTVANVIGKLPKNIMVAGHPMLSDLNSLSITSKRRVYVDYERSLAFTDKAMKEIRRRNFRNLDLAYAKTREEFLEIGQQEGITHYLAVYDFYSDKYLANPVYMNPFSQYLKEKIAVNPEHKFFIKDFLLKNKSGYAILDLTKI